MSKHRFDPPNPTFLFFRHVPVAVPATTVGKVGTNADADTKIWFNRRRTIGA
ncbi:predicted protein [Plenodomus lingam JN3]|uniref:Predicted protein n=1 Tax=Leptosphaeria maculans (strain JN3 / isolate v23.1.3 / race Av1-4-5-6-7-8) TaxID=985895 RepID=E4ZXQ6_LEPMJ|nr:predicted protein [Plenodomus lingam JN3]CBX96151.1 predicted protein [Plenodomus lingam JN3]